MMTSQPKFLLACFLFCLVALAPAHAQAPTAADVETVMKGKWDKEPSSSAPRSRVQINSVKFGQPQKATLQQQQDGVPEGALVTPALIDFSVRNYHSNTTGVVQRVREAAVYKDAFGEWAVMTGSARGQDQFTDEPAVK